MEDSRDPTEPVGEDRAVAPDALRHFRLCPHSRAVRLALRELGVEAELIEERPWEWRSEFLAINPSGELPVLETGDGATICGSYAIAEYLDEAAGEADADAPARIRLFPGSREGRAEVRRLTSWFHDKLNREVTRELLTEKVFARMSPGASAAPEPDVLRAALQNLRYHLSYVGHLADQRRWLAGDEMSFADLAAAAHFSVVDYLGDVRWEEFPAVKMWYQRLKSRPSFRPLLAERLAGMPPPEHYADLDF